MLDRSFHNGNNPFLLSELAACVVANALRVSGVGLNALVGPH
jgi:hypothetical protein